MPLDGDDFNMLKSRLREINSSIVDASTQQKHNLTCILQSLENLSEKFSKQAAPDFVTENLGKQEKGFTYLNTHSAVKVVPQGGNVAQAFIIDFDTQMATIMTLQNGNIQTTETKKLSEMPNKMIYDAQKALKIPAATIKAKRQHMGGS